jgi:hypothetical protein
MPFGLDQLVVLNNRSVFIFSFANPYIHGVPLLPDGVPNLWFWALAYKYPEKYLIKKKAVE